MGKIIIVGSGFSGSILARKIAEEKNRKVLVVERRKHIAGNMFDKYDENGILIQKYGPHFLNTNKYFIIKFLMQYSELFRHDTKLLPIVVFIAVSANFFHLWTPGADAVTLRNLSILLIAHLLFVGVLWPVNNLNTVLNKVKVPALAMLNLGLINLFAILAINHFFTLNIYGLVITQAVLCIAFFGFFSGTYQAHCLGVKWYTFHGAVVKNFIGAGLILIISCLINKYLNSQNWPTLILECGICGILGLIINSLIIFKPSGVKEMLLRFRKIIVNKIKK